MNPFSTYTKFLSTPLHSVDDMNIVPIQQIIFYIHSKKKHFIPIIF